MTLQEIEVREAVIKASTDPKEIAEVKWNLVTEFIRHVKTHPTDNGLVGKASRVLSVISLPAPSPDETGKQETSEPSTHKSRRRG